MKLISEHLGEIVVALAGVALLITAITLFKAPLTQFFSDCVTKITEVGDKMLNAINAVSAPAAQ